MIAYVPWPLVDIAFGTVRIRLLMLRPPGSGRFSIVRAMKKGGLELVLVVFGLLASIEIMAKAFA